MTISAAHRAHIPGGQSRLDPIAVRGIEFARFKAHPEIPGQVYIAHIEGFGAATVRNGGRGFCGEFLGTEYRSSPGAQGWSACDAIAAMRKIVVSVTDQLTGAPK